MRTHRSNPWPALVDLFAALLIATFAGLIVMSAAAERPDENRSKQGEEEKHTAEARLAREKAELAQCLQVQNNLQEALSSQSRQISKLLGGKGLDLPPCLSRDSRPLPLIEIEVLEDGLEVRRLPQQELERLIKEIDGLDYLVSGKRFSEREFSRIAAPIQTWARDPDNAFGFRCSFYAVISPSPEISKDHLSTALAYIDDRFYVLNVADIDRFMKGNRK